MTRPASGVRVGDDVRVNFRNRDSSWSNDPQYKRARAELKTKVRELGLTCVRRETDGCRRAGGWIDVDGPHLVMVAGRLRANPRSFVGGHVIDRGSGYVDHSLLQPECAACSVRSGARAGRAKQGPARSGPVTADLW